MPNDPAIRRCKCLLHPCGWLLARGKVSGVNSRGDFLRHARNIHPVHQCTAAVQIKSEAVASAASSKAAAASAAELEELRKTLGGVQEALAATKRKVADPCSLLCYDSCLAAMCNLS